MHRKKWFEKYPERFESEAAILKSNDFTLDEQALKVQGLVIFRGYSKVEPSRELIVAFPSAFPSSAPKIFDSPSSKLLLRHHRPDNRQLCLFGFNESRWSATCSVGQALVEAEELLSKFKDGASLPSDDAPEPVTRAFVYGPAAILVPPPISTFDGFHLLKSKSGTFYGKFVSQGNLKQQTFGRGIILQANFGGEKTKSAIPFADYFKNMGVEIHGDWYLLDGTVTASNILEHLKECLRRSKAFKKADFYWFALVFKEETGRVGESSLTWLIVKAYQNGKFEPVRTFPYRAGDRHVRIPGLEGLDDKRILLIGCGSVGSKIAGNLAASGVSRFRLVDFDFYEPNNAVRHENGVEFFGWPKEQALLQRLISVNPEVAANSKCMTFQVGNINLPPLEGMFFEFLRDSDIIIDATGIHSVTHYLNEMSYELNCPLLTASVTNGAWGGEVVTIIPGRTPCYLCWLDQYYENGPPSAPTPPHDLFPPGCDQPAFTGTTYDIGFLSNLAASMCVEILLNQLQTEQTFKNYIRWSGKDKSGSPVFLTERLATNGNPDCWCRHS